MATLTRISVLSPDADALAAALAAVADSPFEWTETLLGDGSAGRMAQGKLDELQIRVEPALEPTPTVLEFTVPDRPAAVARLEAAGVPVTSHGEEGSAQVVVGGVRLVLWQE